MAIYTVQGPDGRTYDIQGPDNATSADISNALSGLRAATPTPPQSEGAAQRDRIINLANSLDKSDLLKAQVALPDAGASLIAGLGTSIGGGLGGLAHGVYEGGKTLVNGGSIGDAGNAIVDTAADDVRKAQSYAYQPRTTLGKLASEIGSVPVNAAKEMLSSTAGDVGNLINGAQGRVAGEAIGNVAPDIVGAIYGGRAALKAARPAPTPTPAPQITPGDSVLNPAVNYDVPAFVRNGKNLESTPEPVQAPEATPTAEAQPTASKQTEPENTPSVSLQNWKDAVLKSFPDANFGEANGEAFAYLGDNPAGKKIGAFSPDYATVFDRGFNTFRDVEPVLKDAEATAATETQPESQTTQPETPAQPEPSPAAQLEAKAEETPIEEPETPTKLSESTAQTAKNTNKLSLEDQENRRATMESIGLDQMRKSALEGNAADAAAEFGLTKHEGTHPLGDAASEQFNAERQALENHANAIADNTGGVRGLTEDALADKGRAISAPVALAQEIFEQMKRALYNKAAEISQGLPNVKTTTIDNLFGDRTFQNTAGGHDLDGFVNSAKNQLDFFKENNPQGLSVAVAEEYRKWLNGQWNNANPAKNHIITELKNALDKDVLSSAGGDIYKQGRDLHMMEKKMFNEPKKAARILNDNEYSPLNRNTPYEKVADKITSLDAESFKHVVKTYERIAKMMPELAPAVDRALGTIKAHYMDRILEKGQGAGRLQWGHKAVNEYVGNNASKLQTVFKGPGELHKVKALRDAGNILSVDPTYKGAAAQTAAMMKNGMVPTIVNHAGSAAGGGLGGFIAGPFGAATGATVGQNLAGRIASRINARAQNDAFAGRLVPTSAPKATPAPVVQPAPVTPKAAPSFAQLANFAALPVAASLLPEHTAQVAANNPRVANAQDAAKALHAQLTSQPPGGIIAGAMRDVAPVVSAIQKGKFGG